MAELEAVETPTIDPEKTHRLYDRKRFSWRQVRDCIAGSDVVKRANEVYAPMPSGMVDMPVPAAGIPARTANNMYATETLDYQRQYLPWRHPNPAYASYLQRAKFPDITAATLRGLTGVATKRDPLYTLTPGLQHLEEVATPQGFSLMELYRFCISEVLQTGRLALVLDITADNTVYIAPYVTESYTNWDMVLYPAEWVQSKAVFTVKETGDVQGDEIFTLCYELYEDGTYVSKYVDGELMQPPTQLSFQGRALPRLPLVNLGSEANTPEPDIVPLLGVSDCALDIYRHSADLAQAHFLTCNPTLVFSGIDSDETPRVIGSTVTIGLSNPDANAFYPSTDTSALEHVSAHMAGVFQEAVNYGAALVGPSKRAAESAEALALRQAASGATLVTIVDHVSNGIEQLLQQAAVLVGDDPTQISFEGSTEFAEITLSSQDVLALVQSWTNGAISHETLLENFQEAGILNRGKTIEEEMGDISTAPPMAASARLDSGLNLAKPGNTNLPGEGKNNE
jgi:hypothetical protein